MCAYLPTHKYLLAHTHTHTPTNSCTHNTQQPQHTKFFSIFDDFRESDLEWQKRQAEAFLLEMLPSDFLGTPGAPKLLERMVDGFVAVRRTEHGIDGQLTALARFNTTRRLGEIQCPTMVIHGSADRVMDISNGRSLADRITGASFIELVNAGHFWWFHEPIATCLRVADHMAE